MTSRLRAYLRRWLRWEPCRGLPGCFKMLLIASPFPLPCDCYLLRYDTGAEVPPHRDAVKAGRHYRLNLILKRPRRGGEFVCADVIVDWARVKLFRADVSEHSITAVQEGSRYVLSVGWVLQGRAAAR